MSPEQKDGCYAIYREIHQQFQWANVSRMQFSRLLGSLLSETTSAWRVVGITRNALAKFAQADFKKPPAGIQRAHLFDRAETAKLLMLGNKPLECLTSALMGPNSVI